MTQPETREQSRDPLEPIWAEQPDPEDPVFDAWFDSLSEIQQIAFPTHWLYIDVCNGGFHQYFTNPTGYHAPEALAGFRKLDLHDVAEIVQRATNVFGPDYPRERQRREAFLAKFRGTERVEWDPFYDLDNDFYNALKMPEEPVNAPPDDRFIAALKKLVEELD